MSATPTVEHDAAHQRFVIRIDGEEAALRYRLSGPSADFYTTFVPESLRGRGLAEQLAKAAFEHAKAAGWTVTPSCSYLTGAFLKRHPEYLDLCRS